MEQTKAIVTGGVRGIGRAISLALVRRGVHVVALTHQTVGPEATIQGVETLETDLSNIASVSRIVADIPDANILVNNAGHMNGFGLDQYDAQSREHIFALNLITPVHLMWEMAKIMAARGGGRIVNNTSIAAHIGHPDVWYGATKAGLLNATKSVARLHGSNGVVVNAIAAGPTNTDMLSIIPEERKAAMRNASILGRFAEAEEVAAAVEWLALDSPPYINGSCIDLNNGTFMR